MNEPSNGAAPGSMATVKKDTAVGGDQKWRGTAVESGALERGGLPASRSDSQVRILHNPPRTMQPGLTRFLTHVAQTAAWIRLGHPPTCYELVDEDDERHDQKEVNQ